MALFWLALGWIAYAALHSLLATLALKAWVARRWPGFMPWYRLAYNGIAGVLLLPLAWATYALPGDWLWRWSGAWAWLVHGLALAALAGFYVSSRYYDMGEFLGLRQIAERAEQVERRDAFALSPFHRYVRHPWYFFGLVLVWTRDMNAAWLLAALAVTLYFALGSRLEERKLLVLYGERYRRYRKRVPALIPLPWKTLGREEAENF